MPLSNTPPLKFIVVTGGVLSGLGKGIAAASIGHLFSSALKVVPMKLDGYLNVDPGTMNPIEHGEVFVLDDGGEVDMDFGHYERFLGVTCKSDWNLTMGKVFESVRDKERKGDYLGKTVQYIPHVVNAIKEKIRAIAHAEHADLMVIEVGGTVGDMESELYVEACRQLRNEAGPKNIAYVHLTYVPILHSVGEQKSKPTQQSVALLRQRGIQPDVVIGRCRKHLDEHLKERISMFCDLPKEGVITGLDVDNVYKIPLVFNEEGIINILNQKLGLNVQPNLARWEQLLHNAENPQREVVIAMCGKYTRLMDSYASVIEALNHAAAHLHAKPVIKWIETTDIENEQRPIEEALHDVQGIIVPGGFGARGAEGKIQVVRHARKNGIPFLGLCYGLQLAVIEFARNECHLAEANSTEINPHTSNPVIDLLPEQLHVTQKGATMRLGGQNIEVKKGTRAHALFGDSVRLRFRHRYEVNPVYIQTLEKHGLVFSGKAPGREIMQILELPHHPFFMATQAHPELTSTLDKPNAFFYEFLKTAMQPLTEKEKVTA
ncbi:MAG: CTP synthase (glutamine hydrolyzing) [Candidatus Diapherotrites archaeon]|nr:CTP synthase (glutamine hydrolyzing) [Candidatus Diapherotrites archaeon]